MQVSVIIPCFNAQEFVKETILSVLEQTIAPNEIIVVDDGSTDQSPQIVAGFGSEVTLVRQENRGVSNARNRGVELAKSDLIAFIDADDLWLPNKLERQLSYLNKTCAGVYTEVETFGASSGSTNIASLSRDQRNDPLKLAVHNCFPTPSALLVKKSHSPQFPSGFAIAEDHIYLLELVQRGGLEIVPEPLTRYRKHSGGASFDITSEIRAHQAICNWLDKQAIKFSPEAIDSIRTARTRLLVGLAWGMKHRRRWKEYWQFRHYLESCPQDEEVDILLRNRIYPTFLYALFDAFTRRRPVL